MKTKNTLHKTYPRTKWEKKLYKDFKLIAKNYTSLNQSKDLRKCDSNLQF